MTHAAIYTVVASCPTCERPHDVVAAVVTKDDALSPELRFTLPHACLSCGTPMRTARMESDVRDTVTVMLWNEHHERGAA